MRGEPDFPTPSHIVDARRQRCTRGTDALSGQSRRDGAARGGRRPSWRATTACRTTPHPRSSSPPGATLGIHAALMALLNEGDEVLLPDPIYDAYRSPILLAGGACGPCAAAIEQRPLRAHGRGDRSGRDARLARAAAEHAVESGRHRAPRGRAASDRRRRRPPQPGARSATRSTKRSSTTAARHVSPAALSTELRRATVIVNSLSKTYAMTGWRVGYCAAPAPLIQAHVPGAAAVEPRTGDVRAGRRRRGARRAAGLRRRDAREYAARRQQVLDDAGDVPRVRALLARRRLLRHGRRAGDRHVRPTRSAAGCSATHGVAVVHGAAYGPAAKAPCACRSPAAATR